MIITVKCFELISEVWNVFHNSIFLIIPFNYEGNLAQHLNERKGQGGICTLKSPQKDRNEGRMQVKVSLLFFKFCEVFTYILSPQRICDCL